MRLIENWRKCFDASGIVGTTLMVLSNAYDCLPHGFLIAKFTASGFDFNSFCLLSNLLRSISKLATTSFRSFPREYIVSSSAKLHILELSFMRNKSLENMLKSKEPRTDPCGIPTFILFTVLLSDPIFTL